MDTWYMNRSVMMLLQMCKHLSLSQNFQVPGNQDNVIMPRDSDREEEAWTHMHISVLSKTHILQAHKEFDGTGKN